MRSGSLHEQVSTSRRSLRLVCQSRTTSSQRSKSTVKQASSDRTATTGLTRKQETKSSAASRFYAFITGFPFPLGPLFQRKTCRYEVRTPMATKPSPWPVGHRFMHEDAWMGAPWFGHRTLIPFKLYGTFLPMSSPQVYGFSITTPIDFSDASRRLHH